LLDSASEVSDHPKGHLTSPNATKGMQNGEPEVRLRELGEKAHLGDSIQMQTSEGLLTDMTSLATSDALSVGSNDSGPSVDSARDWPTQRGACSLTKASLEHHNLAEPVSSLSGAGGGGEEHERAQHGLLACDDDISEPEEVDGRVEGLLEQLNAASSDVNQFETELMAARKHYLHVGAVTERQCQQVAQGLKRNIKRATLFYHKKSLAAAQQERARAMMLKYNEACVDHLAAKALLASLETRMMENIGAGFDPELQEEVSDAATKVLEAQASKEAAAAAHQVELERAASIMLEADSLGRNKLLARDIHNARPYFQAKEKSEMLRQKGLQKVMHLDACLREAKQRYANTLAMLNHVSEEVHESRDQRRTKALETDTGSGNASPQDDAHPGTACERQRQTTPAAQQECEENAVESLEGACGEKPDEAGEETASPGTKCSELDAPTSIVQSDATAMEREDDSCLRLMDLEPVAEHQSEAGGAVADEDSCTPEDVGCEHDHLHQDKKATEALADDLAQSLDVKCRVLHTTGRSSSEVETESAVGTELEPESPQSEILCRRDANESTASPGLDGKTVDDVDLR